VQEEKRSFELCDLPARGGLQLGLFCYIQHQDVEITHFVIGAFSSGHGCQIHHRGCAGGSPQVQGAAHGGAVIFEGLQHFFDLVGGLEEFRQAVGVEARVFRDAEDLPGRRVRLHQISTSGCGNAQDAGGHVIRGATRTPQHGVDGVNHLGMALHILDEQDPSPLTGKIDGVHGDNAGHAPAILALQIRLHGRRVGAGLGAFTKAGDSVRRHQIVQIQQPEFLLGVTEHIQQGAVGEGAASVEQHGGALGCRFNQRAIAFVPLPKRFLGRESLAFKAHALLCDEEQQHRHDGADADGSIDDRARNARDFLLHITHVDAGADDPSPRLEALDEGFLLCLALRVVFPLPDVFDVALFLFAYQLSELHKDALPAGVGEIGQVRAVKFGAVGMHHHARVHVGDPEIVLSLGPVTQELDALPGESLGLFQGVASLSLLLVVFCENAPG